MQRLIDRFCVFDPDNIFGIKLFVSKIGYSTQRTEQEKSCPHCNKAVTELHQPFKNREYYVCKDCFNEVKRMGENQYFI